LVNFESPHVHPLALTPDGTRLLACNTADNRLLVFDVTGPEPSLAGSVLVGLDPVSVRVRSNTEAWVVNHLSDSVSVVDLSTLSVRTTVGTADEPCDVVFAGTPLRAFVSCSQPDLVQVFDAAAPGPALATVQIEGEDPKSLAVSPDGQRVYAAVFESGNASTILGGGAANPAIIGFPPNVVSNPSGPYGGQNPPPNSGAGFMPPIAPANNPAPRVGLIVKKDAGGAWRDDNGRDWTLFVAGPQAGLSGRVVGWDMPDNDVAVIDASTLGVTYVRRLMNIGMSLSVNPASGFLTLVGTDAVNQVRFEPNIKGTFIRVNIAVVDPAQPGSPVVRDLNPHLTYAVRSIPMPERRESVGDPRSIVWNAAGTTGYVAGMGSNNVITIDAAGRRTTAPAIGVPEGPTGLALDGARGRLFVLSKFDGSVSTIAIATGQVTSTVEYFDPTPAAIKVGRKHLYDTHRNSGLGIASCASCHVDGRWDRLAWDLGDPQGSIDPLTTRNLGQGLPGLAPGTANPAFQPFHPMKGPMTTQTLQDIIGHEPHHWRGDRLGLENFNAAFTDLQAADARLTPGEMQEFEDLLATLHFPPNPNRNLDNTLPGSLPMPRHFRPGRFGNAGQPLPTGNAVNGLALYRSGTRRIDQGALACVTCHTLPTGAGTNYTWTGSGYVRLANLPQGQTRLALVSTDGFTNVTMKTPQLRNVYEKVGFNTLRQRNTAGFGLAHDGSTDSIERFVSAPAFNVASDQEIADLTAFMLAFSGSDLPQGSTTNPLEPPGEPSRDAHAAVGRQTTLVSLAAAPQEQVTLLNTMQSLADAGKVGLVAKGIDSGLPRGYAYIGAGSWQSDRAAQTLTSADLRGRAAPGAEVTFTVVPRGSQTRVGVDRDLDGFFDRDELDVCDDPADPLVYPGSAGSRDVNADGGVDFNDLLEYLNRFNAQDPRADYNRDGTIDFNDFLEFLNRYTAAC
jgi:YVTN family beta-propeller protein